MQRYLNVIRNFWFFASRGFVRGVRALQAEERSAAAAGQRLHVIIMTGGIGDIVASDPAIRHLAQDDERVVLLARPGYLDMVRFHPNVAAAIRCDSYVQALLLRKVFARARWTNLHVDGHRCNMFRIAIRNPNAAGLTATNYYHNRTLTDVYALMGSGATLPGPPAVYPDPDFDAEGFLREAFGDRQRPVLVVHAQATEAIRSWAPAGCRAAIDAILAAHDIDVIEVGLSPVLPEGRRIGCLRGTLSLPRQLAVLRAANVFVGVDSGFAHAALALGIKSVLLLGKYRNFPGYLPWRPGAADVVLRADAESPNGIPADRIAASIRILLHAIQAT